MTVVVAVNSPTLLRFVPVTKCRLLRINFKNIRFQSEYYSNNKNSSPTTFKKVDFSAEHQRPSGYEGPFRLLITLAPHLRPSRDAAPSCTGLRWKQEFRQLLSISITKVVWVNLLFHHLLRLVLHQWYKSVYQPMCHPRNKKAPSRLKLPKQTKLKTKVIIKLYHQTNQMYSRKCLQNIATHKLLLYIMVTKYSRLKQHPKAINIIISQNQPNLVS